MMAGRRVVQPPPNHHQHNGYGDEEPEDNYDDFNAWGDEFDEDEGDNDDFHHQHQPPPPSDNQMQRRGVPLPPPSSRQPAPLSDEVPPPIVPRGRKAAPPLPVEDKAPSPSYQSPQPPLPGGRRGAPQPLPQEPQEEYEALADPHEIQQRGFNRQPNLPVPTLPPGRGYPERKDSLSGSSLRGPLPGIPGNKDDSDTDEYLDPVEAKRKSQVQPNRNNININANRMLPPTPNMPKVSNEQDEVYSEAEPEARPPDRQVPNLPGRCAAAPPPDDEYDNPDEIASHSQEGPPKLPVPRNPGSMGRGPPSPMSPHRAEEPQESYEDINTFDPGLRNQPQSRMEVNNNRPISKNTGKKLVDTTAIRSQRTNLTPVNKIFHKEEPAQPEVDVSSLSIRDRIEYLKKTPNDLFKPAQSTARSFPSPKTPAPRQNMPLPKVPSGGGPIKRHSDSSENSGVSGDDGSGSGTFPGSGGRRPSESSSRRPTDVLPSPPQPVSKNTAPQADVQGYGWYFSDLPRQESENLVCRDGDFLVRNSKQGGAEAPYTLCVYYKRRVWNLKIRIRPQDKRFGLGTYHEKEQTFSSVSQMIQHHRGTAITLAGNNAGEIKLKNFPEKVGEEIYDETG